MKDKKHKKNKKIKKAEFTSVWDIGAEITTKCKVNTKTKEVFDIETSDDEVDGMLEKEYVTIDGVDYKVYNKNEEPVEDGCYWRD